MFDATARTLSFYVDGRLQDTTPAPAPWAPSGHLVIGRGRFAGNPVDFTQGAIDDVRVYDQALTATDVAQLAISGTWRLDEGAGTTAADDSLEGNDGTLSTGASWTTGVVGPHAVAFDGSTGAIDDVRTYPFPIDAQAAAALATSGLWHLDEGAGSVARDASPQRG